MPGLDWNHDDPADLPRIQSNIANLSSTFVTQAHGRAFPTASDVRAWHGAIYAGCAVPVAAYVGHFRGDPAVPELLDYEVGLGPLQPDGLPENVGLWAVDVPGEVSTFIRRLCAALAVLDAQLPVGLRPTTVDELDAVVSLVALVHGEWVRLHPFANGNGRTARLLAAWLALRYELPIFVTLKPRPTDVAYARAAAASMGRPPAFRGDGHAMARAVFAHMLTLTLLGSTSP